MDVDKLAQEIASLESERISLLAKKKPIEAAILKKHILIQKKKDELAKLKQSTTGFSTEELMLYNPANESNTLYNAQRQFYEGHGFRTSGYLPETQDEKGNCQGSFSVQFYTKEEHPSKLTTEQQIERVLDFFKKYSDKMLPMKDGTLFLDVFEYTLSEYGSYSIRVDRDLVNAELLKVIFGHVETIKKGTFKQVLEYTAEHHYYE